MKLTMKKICASPSPHAEKDITSLSQSTSCACAYRAPPSYSRRDTPAMPWMNIGKNTPFMNTSDSQKCQLPSRSFSRRPVTFGNQ